MESSSAADWLARAVRTMWTGSAAVARTYAASTRTVESQSLRRERASAIPSSGRPTIRRRVRRRGRARFWRCRGRRAVLPDAAVHVLLVARERAWPLRELPAHRSRSRGCTKGTRNRRKGQGWGGGLFATTVARPGLSPRARTDHAQDERRLRQACRSPAASRALLLHAAAASGSAQWRGLGTADYAASSFLHSLFTGSACQTQGASRTGEGTLEESSHLEQRARLRPPLSYPGPAAKPWRHREPMGQLSAHSLMTSQARRMPPR